MKYLCLAYYDEKKFDTLSAEEVRTLVNQCPPLDEALRATGRLQTQASLAHTTASVSLRPRSGKLSITDGPFAETKEQVGGFFIIEAHNIDDAITVAAKHPAAHLGEAVGWGIEIRPLEATCSVDLRHKEMTLMNQSNSRVKPIPDGMHTVTPHLICAGAAAAIDFYKHAFGAVELSRLPDSQGRLLHASLRIGDSTLMLTDEFPDHGSFGPQSLKGTPVTIHLYVENVDTFMERALAAGAKPVMPLEDMFWGDRYGVLEDPFGHRWSVATHLRDVSLEEIQHAVQANC